MMIGRDGMMTTHIGEPITLAELASIIEQFQPETETKSMKPKVQWRCLKTDAPTVTNDYWLHGDNVKGAERSPAVCRVCDDSYGYFRPSQYVKMGYTHWAYYEAPEPPPKPTPFEAWWKRETGDEVGESGQIGIVIRPEPIKVTHWVSGHAAKKIFLAGYEACAKNMAGGAK